MAREADVSNVLPQIITVPIGVTAGVFVGATAGQCSLIVKNLTAGATLFILASNVGSTYAGGTLLANSATFAYSVDATNVVPLEGPTSFYLAATGATATVHILRKLTSGY